MTVAVATTVDALTFAIAGAVVLAGAIGVVVARNPVHAALMLVMTLFGVAVLFIEEQADFLAAVANVERLKYLQSFQRVTAPFAGVITARSVDIGAAGALWRDQGSGHSLHRHAGGDVR